MGTVKQINIKNQTYYFYNDMINIKNFQPNLLKICFVSHASGYIGKKNENKYLIFDSTDENKGLLKKILRCLAWN